ncbi:hypothetical protein RUM44_002857 [Polyplax serrata]|uniref:G-protein coupled receptors family 2 profile 2 domain-containing protein n=1 Tax=Polyplax serrata TaxID=468196 RepID=A0ABR1AWV4_POLSC
MIECLDYLRTLPLEDVCVDHGFKQIHFLVYCPCRTMVCIRKCCSEGEFYNATSDECESNDNLIVSVGTWRPHMNDLIRQYYLLSDTFPSCENPLLLKVPDHAYKSCNRFNKDSDNDFVIFNNGSIKVNKYKSLYEPHQYCGEVTWHENGKIYEQNLILCSALKSEQTNLRPIKSILYGTLLILGGICLLITVSVSLYLPELRRRMHNKIALSHNASLMVAYFTWGIGQLSPNLGDRSCMFIALIIQFTFLGSFFWLNVMCIDISMTFSATRSLGHSNVDVYKKFLCYCIYSWGLTTIISIFTMIMEFLPDVPYDFLKPGFACSCGFNTGVLPNSSNVKLI